MDYIGIIKVMHPHLFFFQRTNFHLINYYYF